MVSRRGLRGFGNDAGEFGHEGFEFFVLPDAEEHAGILTRHELRAGRNLGSEHSIAIISAPNVVARRTTLATRPGGIMHRDGVERRRALARFAGLTPDAVGTGMIVIDRDHREDGVLRSQEDPFEVNNAHEDSDLQDFGIDVHSVMRECGLEAGGESGHGGRYIVQGTRMELKERILEEFDRTFTAIV
jgi:hypothetical protein